MTVLDYSPGPWKAVHRHVHGGPHDDEMAGLGWDIGGPPEPMLRGQFARAADARLMAAAPDLYQALLQVKSLVDGPVDHPETFCRAILEIAGIVDQALRGLDPGEHLGQ